MKIKIATILLASAMMPALIGCGNGADDASSAGSSEDVATAAIANEVTEKAETYTTFNSIFDLLWTSPESKYAVVKVPEGNDFLNVYEAPNEENKIISHLDDGDIIEIADEQNGWIKLRLDDDIEAYVDRNYVSVINTLSSFSNGEKLTTVTVDADTLNLREAPDYNSAVIALGASGEKYQVLKELDGWINISLDGGDAYISSDYVTVSSEYPVIKSLDIIYFND